MDSLKNKTSLITGGAGGLGIEFVKIMLENGIKNVAVVDLPTSQGQTQVTKLEDKYGKNRVVFFPCDVTKVNEIEETFKKVLDAFAGLDILVNNAGMVNEKYIEQMMDLNSTAVIRGSLLALDHMGKHKGGKGGVIINIASIFGLSSWNCNVPVYCATKHAVVGFSRSLANFYYLSEVRVLTLCPGFTKTPMTANENLDRVFDFVDIKHFDIKNKFPQQTADNVSRALLHLIQKGENGTIWVSEDSKPPYVVDLPHYSKLAVPM